MQVCASVCFSATRKSIPNMLSSCFFWIYMNSGIFSRFVGIFFSFGSYSCSCIRFVRTTSPFNINTQCTCTQWARERGGGERAGGRKGKKANVKNQCRDNTRVTSDEFIKTMTPTQSSFIYDRTRYFEIYVFYTHPIRKVSFGKIRVRKVNALKEMNTRPNCREIIICWHRMRCKVYGVRAITTR